MYPRPCPWYTTWDARRYAGLPNQQERVFPEAPERNKTLKCLLDISMASVFFWSLNRIGFSLLSHQVTAAHRQPPLGAMQERRCSCSLPTVLCPSRDRDERGHQELQAHEALKAEKQQQEPNVLMAKLIKRKMKSRAKGKCVQAS